MSSATYIYCKENRKNVPNIPPGVMLCFTLSNSNYPYLEQICMVPKVFEPLKFECKS